MALIDEDSYKSENNLLIDLKNFYKEENIKLFKRLEELVDDNERLVLENERLALENENSLLKKENKLLQEQLDLLKATNTKTKSI